MKAEYINPFVLATVDVFATMLDCSIERGELSLQPNLHPEHDISGVIGLSGVNSGTVIVSLDRQVAICAAGAMLGDTPEEIDSDVIDAVGEIANMIAGKAKAGLEHLEMALSIPTVITGRDHAISFGTATQTICIPYRCKWGNLSVEVGLRVENSVAVPSA